ncbi:anthranilate phosphoribosyltransferase [Marinilabiliaceae bacterium ANBcel2]|nr:anthranilate phosphoribosyltransferase [Marinilabiliaceae bacterium ANBcel2]
MLQPVLKKMFNYQTLSSKEAYNVLVEITRNSYTKSEVVAFLSVYMMRTVTVEELTGFRDALLELCLPVDLSDFNTIDMCGTGGDGKNTFNISTLASFIVAGSGVKVSKHGNYGVSSGSGSSNMMSSMGYRFSNDESILKKELESAGICFLHAPLFHPAMKSVGPVRKELGLKTFFNMLGPMVNPSYPNNQLVGVFDLELARLYQYIYQKQNTNFTIVHSVDGYDEISLTSPVKIIKRSGEDLLKPEDLGFERLKPDYIKGGESVDSAKSIFDKILKGEGTNAWNDVVTANAAMAIKTMFPGKEYDRCVELAADSLHSGAALKALNKLLEVNNKLN